MSLNPIPTRVEPGARGAQKYLRSFSDLYERLATEGLKPPESIDIEQSILGACLYDKTAANKVLEIIGMRSHENSPFYREAHTMIYMAMLALDAKSEQIELLAVTNQLRLTGKLESMGGASYLVELTTRVVTTANVESNARVVLEKYIAREMIRVFEEYKLRVFTAEEDTFELLDAAEGSLFKLAETRHTKSAIEIKPIALDVLEMLDAVDGKDTGVTGIASGLRDLDSLTAGWQDSDLIILAARPSQGKTALSLSFAQNAAMNDRQEARIAVAIFSLEMSAKQLVLRMLCSEAKVDMQRARKGQLTDEEWRRIPGAMSRLSEADIFIDDTASISTLELRAKCRRLKAQHKIGLVIVDYLQLMTCGIRGISREQEISTISRQLKALAKELNIPVIALSQLNRSVESRVDKRPMLSDLRESGAIEQDADMVMFIYRPETYGKETCIVRGNEVSSEGIAEIIVGKQRNGPTDDVTATFVKQFARFENYTNWPTMTPPRGNYTEPREYQAAF